ncbi:hypothetical protein [Streptomyces indicus]|uniref:Uncharacterized protein n=1 Tax=Streptomyces indicus TaxID=417292 RepID=A0A1G9HST7_9ACTN|nr:hypothetical protein [Streptomyces indicus]SDL15774.1 hypothetical protein SAMN05421806_1206 [Streptomyces indicus]
MTQSGQGEEPQIPAARPAQEGVVLPADGGAPLLPGGYAEPAGPAVPVGGQPWGQPWGPESASAQPSPAQGAVPPAPVQPPPAQGAAQPLPASGPDAEATQYIAPVPGQGMPPAFGASAADEAATQMIPPVMGDTPEMGAQRRQLPPQGPPGALPPQAPHAPYAQQTAPAQQPAQMPPAQQSAQMTPPQTPPGALPPEEPAESTYFLGNQPNTVGPGAQPPVSPDAQATQYLPPVPPAQGSGPVGSGSVPPAPTGAPYGIRPGAPGDRQPPAEFDSLFRSEPAGGGTDSTQQMPRIEQPGPAPRASHGSHGGPGGHGGRAAARRGDDGRGGRGGGAPTRGRVLAVVGVGIAVVGIAAGGLIGLLGGDGDEGEQDPAPAAATGPAKESSSAPAAPDPAKAQAVALDKLLADSNNSRDAVIRSVEAIKSCKNLGRAAQDLREAADQRNSLVSRLAELNTDKLPQQQKLRDALNKAWKASASADDHYAAWAGQVAGKKGCPKGTARSTNQSQAGNRASGEATTAKREAAPLWNAIAKQWGLPERTPTQL